MTEERATANQRRALMLVAVVALVAGVVVFALLAIVDVGVVTFAVACVVAVAVGSVVWISSDGVALRLSGAVPADAATHARLHNLLDSLCIASGLPKPAVYVIDDAAPNAFAVGRNPQKASIVVTTGLLDVTSRVELEAVLAHELSHIRNGDIALSTVAVTTVGLLAPSVLPRVVGERRESDADAAAVELTRFPPALISALEKLGDDPASLESSPRSMSHLWIEPPTVTHPSVEDRIAVLREL